MKKNTSPRIIALTFLVALACGCLLTACGCTREAEQPDLKPVIYLYPEQKEEDVSVELDYAGDLTCTYPGTTASGTLPRCPTERSRTQTGRRTTTCTGKARTTPRTISPRASAWREATPRPSSRARSSDWG